jgi:hypothetical protein
LKIVYMVNEIKSGANGLLSNFNDEKNVNNYSETDKWMIICDLRSLNYFWDPYQDKNDMPKLDMMLINEDSGNIYLTYSKGFIKIKDLDSLVKDKTINSLVDYYKRLVNN